MRSKCFVLASTFAFALLLGGCRTDNSTPPTAEPTYSTLPNGARAVAHAGVETCPRYRLTEENRFGAVDGPDEHTFGEIRAVAVESKAPRS